MRLNRRLIALGAVLALAAAGPVRAADDASIATVRALYAGFESALKDGVGDAKSRAALIGGPIAAAFDFPTMARLASGPKWKGFSPEQQAAITEAFGQFFTATYATRLAQAAGGTFAIVPPSTARGATRVVHTRVSDAGGDGSDVDYLVGPDNRVQDVLLNGNVSEVAAMRTRFADPLKSGGADGLLTFLREGAKTMLTAKPAP